MVFYGSSVIRKVSDDIEDMLEVCQQIDTDFLRKRKWYSRLVGLVLRMAAPLL